MEEALSTHLVVGLGNPGEAYKMTRHNLGFMAVHAFANEYQISLRRHKSFKGEFGMISKDRHTVMILMPHTFMNLSGESVRACVDYYKIPHESLIVICDDVALPFGKIRVRKSGSSGGHNGLKSLEHSLMTRDFPRMRIGVGSDENRDLSDYVLGDFFEEEKKKLPEIAKQATSVLSAWIFQDFQRALEVLSMIVVSSKKQGEKDLGLEKT